MARSNKEVRILYIVLCCTVRYCPLLAATARYYPVLQGTLLPAQYGTACSVRYCLPSTVLPALSGTAQYCPKRTVLHSANLYCTARNCPVLSMQYCTALPGTARHCMVLNFTARHCTVLPCPKLPSTIQYCIARHCMALHGTARYCWVLHYLVQCNTSRGLYWDMTWVGIYSVYFQEKSPGPALQSGACGSASC